MRLLWVGLAIFMLFFTWWQQIQHRRKMEDANEELKRAFEALRESETKFRLLFERSADAILLMDPSQGPKFIDCNEASVRLLGYRSKEYLEKGKTGEFGALMHEHWEHKKKRSGNMTNATIDEWYELGRKHGAIGGKLVGAGGGGFLMFYAEDRNRLRQAMARANLEEVRFRFDFEGTKIMVS